jgi:hypothetical protein
MSMCVFHFHHHPRTYPGEAQHGRLIDSYLTCSSSSSREREREQDHALINITHSFIIIYYCVLLSVPQNTFFNTLRNHARIYAVRTHHEERLRKLARDESEREGGQRMHQQQILCRKLVESKIKQDEKLDCSCVLPV